MKAKLAYKKAEPSALIYDKDKKELDYKSIQPGSEVICILQLSGLWFMSKEFGCTWTAEQIKVFKGQALPPCAFIPDGDEENGSGGEDGEEVEYVDE